MSSNAYIIAMLNNGFYELWCLDNNGDRYMIYRSKDACTNIYAWRFEMTVNKSGWLYAPLGPRTYFARISFNGRETKVEEVPAIPNEDLSKIVHGIIYKCDIITLIGSNKGDKKESIYILDENNRWQQYLVPEDFYMKNVFVSPDKTIWLCGYLIKNKKFDENGEPYEILYHKKRDQSVFTEKIVKFDWLTKYKRKHHRVDEHFIRIEFESEPFLATLDDYILDSNPVNMLYYLKKDSVWGCKVLRNKFFGINRLDTGEALLDTSEGLFYLFDKKYRLRRIGSIKGFYKKTLLKYCDIKRFERNYFVGSADIYRRELAVNLEISRVTDFQNSETVLTACCVSHNNGKDWEILYKTDVSKGEPKILGISSIKD